MTQWIRRSVLKIRIFLINKRKLSWGKILVKKYSLLFALCEIFVRQHSAKSFLVIFSKFGGTLPPERSLNSSLCSIPVCCQLRVSSSREFLIRWDLSICGSIQQSHANAMSCSRRKQKTQQRNSSLTMLHCVNIKILKRSHSKDFANNLFLSTMNLFTESWWTPPVKITHWLMPLVANWRARRNRIKRCWIHENEP